MEYKIYNLIRERMKVPFFIRLIFSLLLILFSIIPIILPIFPGSLFLGIFMIITAVILFIPANKVKHLIKIRKGIFYFFKNLRKDSIVKHKMNDISKHVKAILEKRKKRKIQKKEKKIEKKEIRIEKKELEIEKKQLKIEKKQLKIEKKRLRN